MIPNDQTTVREDAKIFFNKIYCSVMLAYLELYKYRLIVLNILFIRISILE